MLKYLSMFWIFLYADGMCKIGARTDIYTQNIAKLCETLEKQHTLGNNIVHGNKVL